jgi:hypothetical protein
MPGEYEGSEELVKAQEQTIEIPLIEIQECAEVQGSVSTGGSERITADIVKREEGRLARPLKVLAPLIKQEIEAGEQAGLEHYRAAGEMLLEAKAQLKHGEWRKWYERQQFAWSRSTAQRYMVLAQVSSKNPLRVFSTLSEAAEPARKQYIAEPAYHQPVTRILGGINVEALRREAESKKKERELVRELGLQLIKIGYRILAEKLHPDKPGGSTEAMTRLNRVKFMLEGVP